eukprot:5358822-Alexandrium_andersonii.AAC.1
MAPTIPVACAPAKQARMLTPSTSTATSRPQRNGWARHTPVGSGSRRAQTPSAYSSCPTCLSSMWTPTSCMSFNLVRACASSGPLLWALCYEILKGSPKANMDEVWAMMVRSYKKGGAKCQFSNLGLSSFCAPDAPRRVCPG